MDRTVIAPTHVLIIHDIEDWPRWKAIFDGAAQIRKQAGEIDFQLLRDEAQPDRIVHFSRWTSHEAARRFFESPELVEIRRVAGVHAPTFLYLDPVETGTL